MTTFKGMNKLNDVCSAMKAKGMDIDASEFDNGGDWYYFKGSWFGIPATIQYNTTNGQFMVYNGFTSKLLASHLSEELDSEEWYKELLNTFYKVA